MPNLSLENANLKCLACGFTISSRYQKTFITFHSQLSLRQTPFGSAVTGHLESCLSYRQLNKMTVELSTVGTNLAGFGEGGKLQKVMASFVQYCRHERAMLVHV